MAMSVIAFTDVFSRPFLRISTQLLTFSQRTGQNEYAAVIETPGGYSWFLAKEDSLQPVNV
jgi:hypothetical protein